MKKRKVILGLSVIIVVGLALRFIPVYTISVEGCSANKGTHRSLIFGATKSDIKKDAQEFITWNLAVDCSKPGTATFKLTVL
ncbi:MAG: hypothetical protein ABI220_01840 [Candidatus Saccharimonadales bacterium]